MIDIEKFICSLIYRSSGFCVIKVIDIINALHSQGLEYKDGKIVRVNPQPEESEDDGDEKIRKEIVGFLDAINKDSLGGSFIADRYGDAIPDDMIPTWIAWIEKQGDTNETINRDEFAQGILRGAAIHLMTWIDYNAAEGNMCLSNMECKDIEDALVSGNWDKIYAYIKKKLEKQGEQKPADITDKLKEEYQKGWDAAMQQLPKEVDSQIWQIANNSAKTWEESFAILYATQKAYDKGRKDASKEQNPAWSEEDKKLWLHDDDIFLDAAKMIVADSPRRSYGGVHKKEIVSWFLSLKERLKSLKDRVQPQPKQEWSSDDNVRFTSTIQVLEYARSIPDYNQYGKEDIDNNITWFKSLKDRYTWRPSGAQIASLTIACDRNDRVGFDLTQLLKDLKRLKG